MFDNSSSSLVTMTTPLLMVYNNTVTKIQFPVDWCDQTRDLSGCICDYQDDVIITNTSDSDTIEGVDSFNDTLADTEEDMGRVVDWWTEGVVLPIICTIGILGKNF